MNTTLKSKKFKTRQSSRNKDVFFLDEEPNEFFKIEKGWAGTYKVIFKHLKLPGKFPKIARKDMNNAQKLSTYFVKLQTYLEFVSQLIQAVINDPTPEILKGLGVIKNETDFFDDESEKWNNASTIVNFLSEYFMLMSDVAGMKSDILIEKKTLTDAQIKRIKTVTPTNLFPKQSKKKVAEKKGAFKKMVKPKRKVIKSVISVSSRIKVKPKSQVIRGVTLTRRKRAPAKKRKVKPKSKVIKQSKKKAPAKKIKVKPKSQAIPKQIFETGRKIKVKPKSQAIKGRTVQLVRPKRQVIRGVTRRKRKVRSSAVVKKNFNMLAKKVISKQQQKNNFCKQNNISISQMEMMIKKYLQ